MTVDRQAENARIAKATAIRTELRKGRSYVTPGGLKFWPLLDMFNSVVEDYDAALVALRERGEPVTKEDAETDAHESFLLDVNHPDHGGIEDTDDALWELVGVAEAYFTADTDDERQTAESMFHSMRARLAAAVPDGQEPG